MFEHAEHIVMQLFSLHFLVLSKQNGWHQIEAYAQSYLKLINHSVSLVIAFWIVL